MEIIVRSVIVYLFIVLGIRVFGKRELAQLSVVDLVFILLISNSVQNAMVGPDTSLWGGVIAAASLFVVNLALETLFFRSRRFSQLIQGDSFDLVSEQDGWYEIKLSSGSAALKTGWVNSQYASKK